MKVVANHHINGGLSGMTDYYLKDLGPERFLVRRLRGDNGFNVHGAPIPNWQLGKLIEGIVEDIASVKCSVL